MQTTRMKKAWIAVVALVLVGIVVAVAAVYLPVAGSTLPSMDDTAAVGGSGAGALSTAVSASTSAPTADGSGDKLTEVPDDTWTPVYKDTDWSAVRGQSGNFILMENITLSSIDTSGETFSGVFDGNGYEIEISATSSGTGTQHVGGLFSILSGTVKNLTISVNKFSHGTTATSSVNTGIVAGSADAGATVSNVRVNLNYDPTSVGSGGDTYLYSSGQAGTDFNMRLGGIIGRAGDNSGIVTINNTTVYNDATGNYGFSTWAWINKGSWGVKGNSQMSIGGFVGYIEGGATVNLVNITYDGDDNGKISAAAESISSRNNQALVGSVVGYADNGSANINGLIIKNKIVLNQNINGWGTNITSASGGVIAGHKNSAATVGWISVYARKDIGLTYFIGNADNGGTAGDTMTYDRYAVNPYFVGDRIAFGIENNTSYFLKQAPSDANKIVSTITTGNSTFNVTEHLIAKSSDEVGQSVWITVDKANTSETGAEINLAASYASNGSFFFDRDLVITEDTGTAYKSAQDYNGANIVSPKVLLKDKDGGAAGSIDGVYVEQNPYATVGEHTLAYTQSAIENAGYKVVDYDGVSYIVSVDGGYIYTPDNVTVAENETTFKLKNDQVIEVVPLDVTVGYGCEDIIYKDTVETVKSKITVSVINKPTFMGEITGFGVTMTTADGDYTASTPAGTVVTIALIEEEITVTDGAENYNITLMNESIEKTVQKLVLSGGTFGGLENLVYNAQSQKSAVFTVNGLGADEITYKYTAKNGSHEIDVVNAGEYTVTATATDLSIELADNSTDFTVTPKEVTIAAQDKEATYSGVAFTEYASLFTAPTGEGSDGTLAITASVAEGVEIKNVGEYTVTAILADASGNYTATDVTATYTVNKATVKITLNEEATTSKVYDGTALSRDDMAALFNVTGAVAGTPAVLDVTVNDDAGEVKNAGKYNLIAGLDGQSSEFYEISSDSVTETVYTIDKIDVEITETNYIGQSFNNEIFTDYGSLFNAPVGIDGITPLELAYSVTLNGEAATIFNCGNYIVTATLAENDVNVNYNAVPLQRQYYVETWEVEVVWGENDYTYNGDVQSVTAKYIDWNDTEKYLEVSFGEGVEFRNAGEYTATASFAEGDNEYGNYALKSETKTNVYNINKADSVINTDDVETVYTYTGALQTVTGAKLNHGEAELVYANNTFTTVAEGNGMPVEISVGESANYYAASTTVQITVNKATPEVTATVEPTEGLFTSSEMPAISTDCAVEGTIAWDTDELTAGAKEYAWTFTPSDTANYNVVTGKTTLTVSAVELVGIEVVSQPSKLDYQYGDTFVSDGMVIEAVYNDGSREVIGDYTVTDGYLTSLGANQITVTYNEKTATVTVNVGARVFELAYNDLTVVAGTQDFDLTTDVTATIAGTVNNTVSLAGTDYSYVLTIALCR